MDKRVMKVISLVLSMVMVLSMIPSTALAARSNESRHQISYEGDKTPVATDEPISASPTSEPTETPKPTITPEPTTTPEPTVTSKPKATPVSTVTPVPTTTPESTATPAPTATPESTASPVPTTTPVPTVTPQTSIQPGQPVTLQSLVDSNGFLTDEALISLQSLPDDPEKYTENIDNGNGTKTLKLYNSAIKYKDNNGEYKYIDNSIVADDTKFQTKYQYKNAASDMQLQMSTDLNQSSAIEMDYQGYSIGFKPLGILNNKGKSSANMSLKQAETSDKIDSNINKTKKYNAVNYSGTFDNNTDITVTPNSGGVKEDIILKQMPKVKKFSYELSVNNLVPILRQDGNLYFIDLSKGLIVAAIPVPEMRDSTESGWQDIAVSLEKTGDNAYKYTLIPDQDFLKKAVYPVIIDPSVVSSQQGGIVDTFVDSRYSSTNYVNSSWMSLGRDSSGYKHRMMIVFNDQGMSYIRQVTSNCYITDVKYYAHQSYKDSASTVTAYLYRINNTNGYTYGTFTWAHQPSCDPNAYTSTSVHAVGDYRWDITDMGRAWRDGTLDNFGILLKTDESSNKYKEFDVDTDGATRDRFEYTYVTAPSAPSSVTLNAPGWTWLNYNPTLSWTGITPSDGSYLSGVQYSTDGGGSWKDIPNVGGDYSNGYSTSINWPEGQYWVYIRGVNNYGNAGEKTSSNAPIYVDKTAPYDVASVAKSELNSTPNVGDNVPVSISFPSTTDKGSVCSGVSQYLIHCSDPNIPDVYINAGSTLSHDYSLRDNTNYTFTVHAKDVAGNPWTSGTSCLFTTTDRTGPNITGLSISDSNNNPITDWTNKTVIKINWSLTDEPINSSRTIYYGIFKNGSPVLNYTTISNAPTSGSTSLLDLSSNTTYPDGEYQIRVYGVDSTGNGGSPNSYATIAYKKDTIINTETVDLQQGDYQNNYQVTKSTVTVNCNADDNLLFSTWRLDIRSGSVHYTDDNGTPLASGTNVDVLNNNYSLDLSSYNLGNYTLRLEVKDTAGNTGYSYCKFTKMKNPIPATLVISSPTGDTVNENTLNSQNGINVTYSRKDNGSTQNYNASLYINNSLTGQSQSGASINVDITGQTNNHSNYPEGNNMSIYVRANDGTNDYFSSDTDQLMTICDDFNDTSGLDFTQGQSSNIQITSDGYVTLTNANADGWVVSNVPSLSINGGFAYIELDADSILNESSIDYYISGDGGVNWITVTPGIKVYTPNIGNVLKLKAHIYAGNPSSPPKIDDWKLSTRVVYYKDAVEFNYDFPVMENGLRAIDKLQKDTANGMHKIELQLDPKNSPQYYDSGSFRTNIKTLPANATQVYLTATDTNESHIKYYVITKINGTEYSQQIYPATNGIPTTLAHPSNIISMEVKMDSGNDHNIQPAIDNMSLDVYQNILGDKIMKVNLIDPPHNLSAYPEINYKTLLRWDPSATVGVTYNVYRSKDKYFEPGDVQPIATGITDTYWSDFNLDYGQTYYYLVTAVKTYTVNGSEVNKRESTPTSNVYATVVAQNELDKKLGLENYWTYTSFRTDGGEGYVNVANGNVVYSATDLTVTGPSFAMVMRRTYNSLSSSRTSLGDGWDYSFNTCLLIEYKDDGITEKGLILKDGDGSIHRFKNTQAQPNVYLPVEQIHMEIDKVAMQDEDGKTYYLYNLKRNDSIVYHFDRYLRLTSFTEPNGNHLDLHYDARGNVDKVTNSVGDSLYLIYDSVDRLIAATDGIPTYDSNRQVTSVQGGRTYIYQQPEDMRTVELLSTAYNQGTWTNRNLIHQESYAYSATDNSEQMTITDPKNNPDDSQNKTTTLTLVGQPQNYVVNTITFPNNEIYSYTLNQTDKSTTITDALKGYSSQISYVYNGIGQVTQYTDADNHVVNYQYDSPNSYQPSGMSYDNTTWDIDSQSFIPKHFQHTYDYDENGNIKLVEEKSVPKSNENDDTPPYTLLAETSYEEYNSFNKPKYVKVRAEQNSETYNTTGYTYDSCGNVLTVTDPMGRLTTNTYYDTNIYDENMNLISYRIGLLKDTTDCYFKKTVYSYDAKGRVIQTDVYDKTGKLTSSAKVTDYDDYNQLHVLVDEMGNKTVYNYNPFGQPDSIVKKNASDTLLSTTNYQYDQNFNLNYQDSGLGTDLKKTWYHYDEMDRVDTTQQLVNVNSTNETKNTQTVSFDRNADGDFVTTTTENSVIGNQISVSYYDKAGLLKKTTENGVTTTENTEFDNLGNVLTHKVRQDVNSGGYRIDKSYFDDYGRPVETIVDFGNGEKNITDKATYDFLGNQLTATDGEGHVTTYAYDVLGRLSSVKTPTNDITSYLYDQAGDTNHANLYGNKTTDANGRVSYTWLDSLGRKVQTETTGIITSKYTYYDPTSSILDNKGYSSKVKDQITCDTNNDGVNDEVTQEYKYDDLGRERQLTYYNGSTEGDHQVYTYDGMSNVKTNTLYDVQGNIKSQESYTEYDRLGRVLQCDQNGLNINYQYGDGYNLTMLRYDNGQNVNGNVLVKSIQYQYDNFGRLRDVNYDPNGTPSANGNFEPVRKYDYNTDNSVKTITDYRQFNDSDTAGKILRSLGYDTAGRLQTTTSTDSTSDATTHKAETDSLTYYNNGFIKSETIANDFTGANEKTLASNYQYYDNGALHIASNDVTDSSGTKNTTETYSYDGVGNRTGLTIDMTGCPKQDYSDYQYNDFNQLTSVRRKIGDTYTLKNVYTYDGRGNQVGDEENHPDSGTKPSNLPNSIDVSNVKTIYTYNNANQLVTSTINYPDDNAIRKLIQTNTYNADGQRISKKEDTYQKDNSHFDDPNHDTVVSSTSKYYYTGSAVLFTTNDNIYGFESENILTPGGTIVASERFDSPYNNRFLFYNYDYKGSTTNLLDPDTGMSIKDYTYDPFGNTSESGSNVSNEIKFNGSVNDASTGLYDMNARFYNPSTGRFLTQDTYSGNAYDPWTQHLYAYCGNNPTTMIDPTGHRFSNDYDDRNILANYQDRKAKKANKVTPKQDCSGSGGESDAPQGGSGSQGSSGSTQGGDSHSTILTQTPDLPEGTKAFAEEMRSFNIGFYSYVSGTAVVYDKDKYALYSFSGGALSAGVSIPVVAGYTFGTVTNVTEAEDYCGNFFGSMTGTPTEVSGSASGSANGKTIVSTIEGGTMPGCFSGGSGTGYTLETSGWVSYDYNDLKNAPFYNKFLLREKIQEYSNERLIVLK